MISSAGEYKNRHIYVTVLSALPQRPSMIRNFFIGASATRMCVALLLISYFRPQKAYPIDDPVIASVIEDLGLNGTDHPHSTDGTRTACTHASEGLCRDRPSSLDNDIHDSLSSLGTGESPDNLGTALNIGGAPTFPHSDGQDFFNENQLKYINHQLDLFLESFDGGIGPGWQHEGQIVYEPDLIMRSPRLCEMDLRLWDYDDWENKPPFTALNTKPFSGQRLNEINLADEDPHSKLQEPRPVHYIENDNKSVKINEGSSLPLQYQQDQNLTPNLPGTAEKQNHLNSPQENMIEIEKEALTFADTNREGGNRNPDYINHYPGLSGNIGKRKGGNDASEAVTIFKRIKILPDELYFPSSYSSTLLQRHASDLREYIEKYKPGYLGMETLEHFLKMIKIYPNGITPVEVKFKHVMDLTCKRSQEEMETNGILLYFQLYKLFYRPKDLGIVKAGPANVHHNFDSIVTYLAGKEYFLGTELYEKIQESKIEWISSVSEKIKGRKFYSSERRRFMKIIQDAETSSISVLYQIALLHHLAFPFDSKTESHKNIAIGKAWEMLKDFWAVGFFNTSNRINQLDIKNIFLKNDLESIRRLKRTGTIIPKETRISQILLSSWCLSHDNSVFEGLASLTRGTLRDSFFLFLQDCAWADLMKKIKQSPSE